MKYTLFLAVATIVFPATARFTDLTAPGHGTDLYDALEVPQPIMEGGSGGVAAILLVSSEQVSANSAGVR